MCTMLLDFFIDTDINGVCVFMYSWGLNDCRSSCICWRVLCYICFLGFYLWPNNMHDDIVPNCGCYDVN